MTLSTKALTICVVVGGLLACGSHSLAADAVAVEGKAVDGLRLELRTAVTKKGEKSPPLCEVVLENVGDRDLNLMLGYSLANGKSHHPAELKLIVTAPAKPRTLIHAGGRVAGRVDPLVIPLPAGSRYSLRLMEKQFADEATGDSINLPPKDCRLVAEFTGKAIEEEGVNGDMEGLALIPCWKGTVRSNELLLPPTAKPASK